MTFASVFHGVAGIVMMGAAGYASGNSRPTKEVLFFLVVGVANLAYTCFTLSENKAGCPLFCYQATLEPMHPLPSHLFQDMHCGNYLCCNASR